MKKRKVEKKIESNEFKGNNPMIEDFDDQTTEKTPGLLIFTIFFFCVFFLLVFAYFSSYNITYYFSSDDDYSLNVFKKKETLSKTSPQSCIYTEFENEIEAASHFLKNDLPDPAIICIEQTIDRSPQPEYKWMLAFAYSMKGNFKMAIKQMKNSQMQTPSFYNNLALIHSRFNYYKEAKRFWNIALDLIPPDDNNYRMIIEQNMIKSLPPELNQHPIMPKYIPSDEGDDFDDDDIDEEIEEDEEIDEENSDFFEEFDQENNKNRFKNFYKKRSPFQNHPSNLSPNPPKYSTSEEIKKAESFFQKKLFDKALTIYESEIHKHQNNIPMLNNMAVCYFRKRMFEKGINIIRRAIEIEPNSDYLYLTAANGFVAQSERNCEHAIKFLRIAINLNPDYDAAKSKLAHCLYYVGAWKYTNLTGWIEEADMIFSQLLDVDPYRPEITEELFGLRNWIGNWNGYKNMLNKLIEFQNERLEKCKNNPRENPRILHIFTSLREMYPDELILRLSKATLENLVENTKGIFPSYIHYNHKPPSSTILKSRRLRLGYLSGNLDSQPMGQLLSHIFQKHDRKHFEVWCFAVSPNDDTFFRQTIENGCEHFIDCHNFDWITLLETIGNTHLDVLISLDGQTYNSREEVLVKRPAPIQIHFMGLPHTTAASFIDYYICDNIACPPESRNKFTEKLLIMPHSYYANSYKYQYDPFVDKNIPLKEEFDYPVDNSGSDPFIFANFGIVAKIKPWVFDRWMNILKRAPNSLLRLRIPESARLYLLRRAKKLGISSERFIFQDYQRNKTRHMQEVYYANLILDTFPYNGHTTTTDALWNGVPVLTILNNNLRMASRVSASILKSLGLEEIIANNYQSYEDMAVKLATEPQYYQTIRQKLLNNRLTYPTFDTKHWVSDLEKGIIQIFSQYINHTPFTDIIIPPSSPYDHL